MDPLRMSEIETTSKVMTAIDMGRQSQEARLSLENTFDFRHSLNDFAAKGLENIKLSTRKVQC